MKTTGNLNINTRNYWNQIYGSADRRVMYEQHGTDEHTFKNTDDIICTAGTKRFKTALKYIKDGDRVIDIGCGVGVFTNLVKETYPACEVWGTDISDKAIEADKKDNPDIKYHHGYIGDQDFLPREYFDVVFCGETIEHLEEPLLLFTEAYKILKPGGKLIITTPREEHIQSQEHIWYFLEDDVENFYKDTGFECEFIRLPDMEHLFVIFGVGTK